MTAPLHQAHLCLGANILRPGERNWGLRFQSLLCNPASQVREWPNGVQIKWQLFTSIFLSACEWETLFIATLTADPAFRISSDSGHQLYLEHT